MIWVDTCRPFKAIRSNVLSTRCFKTGNWVMSARFLWNYSQLSFVINSAALFMTNTRRTGLAQATSTSKAITVGSMARPSHTQVRPTADWIIQALRHSDFRIAFHSLGWFPGWPSFDNYNRQPNDDGLSNQDCVEIRRHFNKPASSASFVTDSFMWNDLDCSTENFFICERPMIDGREWFVVARGGCGNKLWYERLM